MTACFGGVAGAGRISDVKMRQPFTQSRRAIAMALAFLVTIIGNQYGCTNRDSGVQIDEHRAISVAVDRVQVLGYDVDKMSVESTRVVQSTGSCCSPRMGGSAVMYR